MMKVSVLMNCMIPLICHFMYARGILNSTEFILTVYDTLFMITDIDIYNKLYETATSNIQRTAKRNQTIWAMQDIRGISPTSHATQSCLNIIINIIPKYKYDGNLVHCLYSCFSCFPVLPLRFPDLLFFNIRLYSITNRPICKGVYFYI